MKRFFLIGLSLIIGAFTLPFLACGGGNGGGSAPSASGNATMSAGEPDDAVAAMQDSANNQTAVELTSYTVKGSIAIPTPSGDPVEFHGQHRVSISAVPTAAGTFDQVIAVMSVRNDGSETPVFSVRLPTRIASMPGSRWVSGQECPRQPPPPPGNVP